MIIDTKFSVGGTVWVMEYNRCVEKTIKELSVTVRNNSSMSIHLWIETIEGYQWVKADNCYLTKEDLLKSL